MPSTNPSRQVRQAFERIGAERMAGLPLLNDALAVEVVGFLDHAGQWVGVLITPWCLNLMVLPGDGEAWLPPAEGVWRMERFPGMQLQLLGGSEPGVGAYAFRSLQSPVTGYHDQDTVRAVAREVLKQLLTAPPAQEDAAAAPAEPPLPGGPRAPPPREVTRRRLLGGG